jgi:hypothetical protein
MRLVIRAALTGVLVLPLSACYTQKTVLTNDQGETQTCEHKGHVGIVSPIRVYVEQKSCVDKAKAAGYKETPSAPTTAAEGATPSP